MMRRGGAFIFLKKGLSSRRLQCTQLPVFLLFLTYFASMFPEVFISLDVQLNKVADFDRVDFTGATVADLRK